MGQGLLSAFGSHLLNLPLQIIGFPEVISLYIPSLVSPFLRLSTTVAGAVDCHVRNQLVKAPQQVIVNGQIVEVSARAVAQLKVFGLEEVKATDHLATGRHPFEGIQERLFPIVL